MRKCTRWSKFSNFSFLHKTEEKCHRIYFLVFLLPNSLMTSSNVFIITTNFITLYDRIVKLNVLK